MYIVGNQVDIGIPPIGNLNTSNPIVMEFEKDCNKIGKASWDYSAYVNLKSKLETFSNGSNASITPELSLKLKESLEQQDAESMKVSFQNWLANDGNNNINDLFNVMLKQKLQNGCEAILESPIAILVAYNNALNMPNQINNFLKTEFDEKRNTDILNNLNASCNNVPEIRNLTTIQNIKNQAMTELKDFKIFTDKFNEGYSYYISNPTRKEVMMSYCPNVSPSITRYDYYLNKIQDLKICN